MSSANPSSSTNPATSLTSSGAGYHIAKRIAAVAGIFALIVCALLLYDFSRRQAKDPLDDAALKALFAASAAQPQNETLKQQARERDLEVRFEYFRHRAFIAVGAFLLLLSLSVCLLASKVAATLNRRLPKPGTVAPAVDKEAQWTPIARWAVIVLGIMLVSSVAALSLTMHSELLTKKPAELADATPTTPAGGQPQAQQASPQATTPSTQPVAAQQPPAMQQAAPETTPAQPAAAPSTAAAQPSAAQPSAAQPSATQPAQPASNEPPPSDEEIHKMWPRFRGPDGLGISAYTNVPNTWDGESGKNILWKVEVPLPGNNSPVVWGNRVFLSSGDAKQHAVYCFDIADGKMVWQQPVPGTPQSMSRVPKINDDTGHAASTMATDGRRVFAIYSNGDLAAFDVEGKPAWAKSLGIPDNSYGYAASLAMYKNLLLVQFDQGGVKTPKSKLFAFDSATGNIVWQTDRPVPNSWSSPIVIRNGEQDQIITSANPWVIAYDPTKGEEIWRANCLRTDIGPSPVFADGKIYVANDNSVLSAIRADGKGDVTATHIAWKGEDGMPDIASPLATKEFVFLLASFGQLTCYDAEKGEMLWQQDVDGSFSASPSLIGNRLLLQNKEGKAYWLEPTREKCNQIGEANLGEECVTSPAFQDGRIYLRGKDHLFCIGTQK
jgi:outer membrane protein assembly factor BamB